MIENPLYPRLAADGLTPADFDAALAAHPPKDPAERHDLIRLEDIAADEYRLLPAERFTLYASSIFAGIGFYVVEMDGETGYRFAGAACFSQVVLPLALSGAAKARIGLRHVFESALVEGCLAFINGVRVVCAVEPGKDGPAALIVDIPDAELLGGQAAVLTLVPPGHIPIEDGRRKVCFAMTEITVGGADAGRVAIAEAGRAIYMPVLERAPSDLKADWAALAEHLSRSGRQK